MPYRFILPGMNTILVFSIILAIELTYKWVVLTFRLLNLSRFKCKCDFWNSTSGSGFSSTSELGLKAKSMVLFLLYSIVCSIWHSLCVCVLVGICWNWDWWPFRNARDDWKLFLLSMFEWHGKCFVNHHYWTNPKNRVCWCSWRRGIPLHGDLLFNCFGDLCPFFVYAPLGVIYVRWKYYWIFAVLKWPRAGSPRMEIRRSLSFSCYIAHILLGLETIECQ